MEWGQNGNMSDTFADTSQGFQNHLRSFHTVSRASQLTRSDGARTERGRGRYVLLSLLSETAEKQGDRPADERGEDEKEEAYGRTCR